MLSDKITSRPHIIGIMELLRVAHCPPRASHKRSVNLLDSGHHA